MIMSMSPDLSATRPLSAESLDALMQPSEELDQITRTARRVLDAPIALVSLLDGTWQWLLSHPGLAMDRTPRSHAFCAHAILEETPMVVPNALEDPRFVHNPLVTQAPFIRFYAGHTVRSRSGHPLGTLCVLDTQPRTFTEDDRAALADLAALAEQHLHLREAEADAAYARRTLAHRQALLSHIVDHAGVGIAVLNATGHILESNPFLKQLTGHQDATLVGIPFTSLLDLRDHEASATAMTQALRGDRPSDRPPEVRFLRPDGEEVWVQIQVSRLPTETDQGTCLLVVASDVHALLNTQRELQALQGNLQERIRERTAALDASTTALEAEALQRNRAHAALLAEREYTHRILEETSDAFVEIDGDDRILTWNASAERIFGRSAIEVLGQHFSRLVVPAPLRARHRRWLRRLRATGHSARMKQRIETEGLRRNGTPFPMEMTFSATKTAGQMRVHGFLSDISQRKADETALRQTTRRLTMITDHVPAMIAHIGTDLRYRFHNAVYFEWFELPPQGLVGQHLTALWGETLFEQLHPQIDRVRAGERVNFEYALTARHGTMWFQASLVPHLDDEGRDDGFYLLAQDITERKRLYERIEHEATHDLLTGLPNRRGVMKHLTDAMARARRHQRTLGVMFMDLDGFKQLNDTQGHEYGDAVLQRFAADIVSSIRTVDFVGRLSGDEFVVVLEELSSLPEALQDAGNAILQRINTKADVLGVPVRLGSSIGAVTYDHTRDDTPEQLLARADAAMYEAKSDGKNRIVIH